MAGHDFAKGSRFAAADGTNIAVVRRSGVRALTSLVNVLFETRYSDLGHGYNAFRRDCLEHLQVDHDGFEVGALIDVRIARAGLRVAEVPSAEHERMFDDSAARVCGDGLRALRTIISQRVGRAEPEPRRLRVARLLRAFQSRRTDA
jgi:hypothetical protein